MKIRTLDWTIVGLMLVALLMIFVAPAYASGDRIDVDATATTGDLIGGDLIGGDNTASNIATNSIAGSRSYGASHSLGDVDLNQCMGSTQWGSIIVSRQKLVLNKWCAAESYDAKGMFKMAALLRCDIPEISKHFIVKAECVKENTTMFPVKPPDEPKKVDRDDEDYKALRADLEAFKGQIAQAREDTRKARIEAQRASAVAQEANKPQIVPRPFLTDEKRAKLQAVLDER